MADEEIKPSFRRALKAAFPHTTPVLTGFMVLGIAYGMLMNTKGYGPLWACLMSALAFGGSMQYVAITLLTTAFDPLQAFLLSIMVNARHLFYGIAMLDKMKGMGKLRNFVIFWLCDETFSILSSVEVPHNVTKTHFYLAVAMLDYCYWVAATFIGEVLGSLITFNTTGLDFVLTALFVVLFIEQLMAKSNRLPGLIGMVSTAAMLVVFGSTNFVIPSMILIFIVLVLGRRKGWFLQADKQ